MKRCQQFIALLVIFTFIIQPVNVEGVWIESDVVPVVFVHGYSDNGESWKQSEFYNYLRQSGVPVYSVDYGQYSKNDITSKPVMSIMDETVKSVIDKYEKFDIVAHSMGGLLTRWYLLKNENLRKKVRKAIFIGTPNHGSHIAMGNRISDMLDEPDDYFGPGREEIKEYKRLYDKYVDQAFNDWNKGKIISYQEWLYKNHREIFDNIEKRQNNEVAPFENIGVEIKEPQETIKNEEKAYRYSAAFEEYAMLLVGRWKSRQAILIEAATNEIAFEKDTRIDEKLKVYQKDKQNDGRRYAEPSLQDEMTELKEDLEENEIYRQKVSAKNIVQDRLMRDKFRINLGVGEDGGKLIKEYVANPFLNKLNTYENKYREESYREQEYFPQYITIPTKTKGEYKSDNTKDNLTAFVGFWGVQFLWNNVSLWGEDDDKDHDIVVPIKSVPIDEDYRFLFDYNDEHPVKKNFDIPHTVQMKQTELLRKHYENPLTGELGRDGAITYRLENDSLRAQGDTIVLDCSNTQNDKYRLVIEADEKADIHIVKRDKYKTWETFVFVN